jgi:hypothetical protein
MKTKITLKNKYIIGCHVMFYEVEMFNEYVQSCVGMLKNIENHKNVTFHFTFNWQEHYEKFDYAQGTGIDFKFGGSINKLQKMFHDLDGTDVNVLMEGRFTHENFYNIADYRRELNDKYCNDFDYVLWGETDSLWPSETLTIVEMLNEQLPPKHSISFGERKMWDESWKQNEHPIVKDVQINWDNEKEVTSNEYSSKGYMTYDEMCEINKETEVINVVNIPKFDGSCLVISSELIKSGVNIPHSLILAGEDTAFCNIATKLLGNTFHYVIPSILHVHNRRHPKKRMYILNENNPNGFCDDRKGEWWNDVTEKSKFNLNNLFNIAIKFKTL